MPRFIASYTNDSAIQEAVDNKTLGKPYVALNGQTGKIDWNGKTPPPEGYYFVDSYGHFYQLQEGGSESNDIATGSFIKPAGASVSLYHNGVLLNILHGNVMIKQMCNGDVVDSWWQYTTMGMPIEDFCPNKELEFYNSGLLDSDEVSVSALIYETSMGGIDANMHFDFQSCAQ